MSFLSKMAPNGMQGLGPALQEASPLLLAMGGAMQQGLPAFSGAPNGLAAMMAQQEKRKEAAEKARASSMIADLLGGGAPMKAPGTFPGDVSSALPASLIRTESGGKFSAKNSAVGAGGHVGHFGRGQFGVARLEDAKRAGVIPADMTPDQFMANPSAQQAVEQWHVGDIQGFIKSNGLDRYVGQTINGVTVTPNGMLAVAHLGGNGGLKRFLETGGAYNPADDNGTSLLDYLGTHAGGQQRQPQRRQIDPQRAAEILQNPHVSAAVKQMVLAQIQPEKPQKPETLKAADGYTYFISGPQAGQRVLPEVIAREPAGVTVNNNFPEQAKPLGTKGQILVPDPEAPGNYRVEIAPGSEMAREIAAEEEAKASADETQETYGSIVLDEIGRLKGMLEGGRNQPVTGVSGQLAAQVPGSEASDARALSKTIRSNIGFDRLQQMRRESPTGGALGNVTERELAELQAVLGNLEFSQSKPQLLYNLDRLEQTYKGILDKIAATGDGTLIPRAPSAVAGDPNSQAAAPSGYQFSSPEVQSDFERYLEGGGS